MRCTTDQLRRDRDSVFKGRRASTVYFLCAALSALILAGCAQNHTTAGNQSSNEAKAQEREEKTRQAVANATERAKPAIQDAGKHLREGAKVAGQELRAAAQGVREGWNRNGQGAVDVNTADESELTKLSGITDQDARRIIRHRPYESKHQLVTKGVLSEARYEKIRDQITAK